MQNEGGKGGDVKGSGATEGGATGGGATDEGAGPPTLGICDSCGREEDLRPVHRLYIVPESWDATGSVTRIDEIEHWCFPCRSLYPHEE